MSDLVGNPEDRFSRVAAQFTFHLLRSYDASKFNEVMVMM